MQAFATAATACPGKCKKRDDDFVSSYEKQHPLLVPRALKQNVKRGSISRLPTGMTGTAAASTTSGETTIRRVIVS